MVDISKAFGTPSEPIADFFQRPGIAYYIPLYQREYSWDSENIDQLMDDIFQGVEVLMSDDTTIRFMGSLILIKEKNAVANIRPRDNRALPSTIFNVIDGQQRISTIALLACLLYERLYKLRKKLPSGEIFSGLQEEIKAKLEILEELFSFDLKRGNPHRKPVIIRGSIDCWTFDGNDEDNYISTVSNYISKFIRAIIMKADFPKLPKGGVVGGNLRRMYSSLNKVEKAHELEDDTFPAAWVLIDSNINEEYLWSYSRPELVEIIKIRNEILTTEQKLLCSFVQLFAFQYYLLQRCCFTLIEPVEDKWAFDMFQSLNASGTPLTAVETFKPLVVNWVDSEGDGYKESNTSKYFDTIDQLFGSINSAAKKNKLTNEYLTTFALTHDGTKLSSQFSVQRKWLHDKYDEFNNGESREEFIRQMSDLATYWKQIIYFDPREQVVIKGLNDLRVADKHLATFCALYLRDANHKMANTILSRFYAHVIRGDRESAPQDFATACKVVAAFFTLWRAALPNAGLDDAYRQLLKGDNKEGIDSMSWTADDNNLSIDNLKMYFKAVLDKKRIGSKETWIKKATQDLSFDKAKVICKFTLFVTAHDTIVDPDYPALMKVGAVDTYPYFEPNKWICSDFRYIEHIAPQNPINEGDWSNDLYEDDDYQRIGNLTLLPLEINSSAGNKCWREKLIYYKHLAETDPDNLAMLAREAKVNGITLADDTIELLRNTTHKHHIKPLVELGMDGLWNKNLVTERTERMCDILWTRISKWLD